jgi:hypothetical protein
MLAAAIDLAPSSLQFARLDFCFRLKAAAP